MGERDCAGERLEVLWGEDGGGWGGFGLGGGISC